VLGTSVKKIDKGAMKGLPLESVYMKSNTVVDLYSSDSLYNNSYIKIYVPFDLVDAYKSTYPWNMYNIIGFDFENNDI
jgi:hypothetical protein